MWHVTASINFATLTLSKTETKPLYAPTLHTDRTLSISLAIGNIEKVDFYDLVIASGASTCSPLLGVNQDGEFLRTIWTAFRKALSSAKSIVVATGGRAGIETGGELGEFLNGRAGWFNRS